MNDADFRTLLHDRLGPALDELSAPDVLVGVRSREVQHKRSVRAGLALASAATVTAVVVAVAVWPQSENAGPSAPATPSLSVTTVPSAAASALPSTAAPSPSTAIVNLIGLAPLVSSGPCAGLTVGAFLESSDIHPAITAITAAGASFTAGGGQIIDMRATGPCVGRLSFIQRTATFQDNIDVPYSFIDGEGGVVTQGSATNQTGAVQLFLDCKGLVCSDAGAPLATVTVRVRGTGLGAGSQPFSGAPTPLPVPTGEVVVIPSVVGLTVDAAEQQLSEDRIGYGCGCFPGVADSRLVTGQDPVAGSTVPRTGASVILMAAGPGPRPPLPSAATGSVALPSHAKPAGPSLPPPTTATMPALVGLQLAHAEKLLAKANIVYVVVRKPSAKADGIVLSQSPVAGAIVGVHSKIELTVSLGP